MNKFTLIKKKIETQIKKSEASLDFLHSQLTWKWALKLKPKADIPFQIAALGHDYERSFPGRERAEFHNTYNQYKQAHARKSAQLISRLMKEYEFLPAEIKRTNDLIKNHEVGGVGDSQVLTDADSLAFFEGNARHYSKIADAEETKNKFVFMYERMSANSKNLFKKIRFKDKKLKKLIL